ncbi:hypothetical protein TL16_g08566 [Triparma laevis f. inornata]|uniref:Sodium/calcium exchanger membrane region domain-containing protein n=1 Tax=Triparma laevis f. inornata TaxID=1714386 RepID=A0A9W7EKM5_9STRA|nr:hypothetical protein TL16_g08566 [Triparma laevis f. inornata]
MFGGRGSRKAVNTQTASGPKDPVLNHGLIIDRLRDGATHNRSNQKKKAGKLWKKHAAYRSAKRAHKKSNRHNIFFTAMLAGLMLFAIYAYDGGSRGTRVAMNTDGNLEKFDFLGILEEEVEVVVCKNETDRTQKQIDCDANDYCISPEYFEDPFTEEQLRGGALAFHFLVMIWMFAGLAIVCDDYFESSLESICESLDLKEDVAGATFMAAGGSAPELFTSVMGVFVSKNDIGFGTIVGSAVFNVLFVIAMCAFVVPNLKVTWWPLARDCVSYCIGIIALVGVVIDFEVHHFEAAILLMFYAGYVTIMYFNDSLEIWTTKQVNASIEANKNMPPWKLFLHKIVSSTPFDIIIYAGEALRGAKRRAGSSIFMAVMSLHEDSMRSEATSINNILN